MSFVSPITIPDNFTLADGSEYEVTDKTQQHVIMTKPNTSFSGTVYTLNATAEYAGITCLLTGFGESMYFTDISKKL